MSSISASRRTLRSRTGPSPGTTPTGWSSRPAAAAKWAWDTATRAASRRSWRRGRLASIALGSKLFAIPRIWEEMRRSLRNVGNVGVGAMALSAAETALWDLLARVVGLPLAHLFGMARSAVPIYGSGGFINYDDERLRAQLEAWAAQGLTRAKIKVGRPVEEALRRVRLSRETLGPEIELFVDANGCFDRKEALDFAWADAESQVRWFEEPVSSDDVEGLRLLRDRSPPGMQIATGEYGYSDADFLRWLQGGCVDALQADATRCGGFSGFLAAARLAKAFSLPFSAHCAPALHLAAAAAAPSLAHIEWFHDHVRIEATFLDGVIFPEGGALHVDASRPGNGLSLKHADLEPFRV